MKRVGCGGVLALLFIVATGASMFAKVGPGGIGSEKDTSGTGYLALTLLMEELGFNPSVFAGSPKELVQSDVDLLVLLGLPATVDEQSIDSFGLGWYADYVERGGDLVISAASWHDFELLWDEFEFMNRESIPTLGERGDTWTVLVPSLDGLGTSEKLVLKSNVGRILEVGTEAQHGAGIWRAEGEYGSRLGSMGVAQVTMRYGAGRLVLLGGPGSFMNLRIVEGDNALIFTRLIETLQAGRDTPPQLFFDRSLALQLGGRSWVSALFQAPLLPTTLAVILALCLWAWSYSARRSFPLNRHLDRHPPAGDRARTLARLMSRAGHTKWPAASLNETFSDPPTNSQ